MKKTAIIIIDVMASFARGSPPTTTTLALASGARGSPATKPGFILRDSIFFFAGGVRPFAKKQAEPS